METLKQIKAAHTDSRGEIFNLFEGRIEHIALITSKKGTVRANHYHKQDLQYIYLVSGEYESYSCPIEQPENVHKILVNPGDIVKTPPLVAHAQKFTKDSVFLAFSTRLREEGKYEDDTLAYPVIQGYLNKVLKAGKS